MSKNAKVIALYLPQYHPTPDNDAWWGEGFTEWTNVAKAKKLYKGHYQPRIPANLGFYDLRLPEIREKQVEMAKRAGVDAFCYYHYWFGNGKQELERPFNEVVASGKPDFPFCLCWANEPWFSKMWNQDGTIEKTLLVDQVYPGKEENEQHFYSMLDAFKDSRYYRINDRLVFMVYKPYHFKGISAFMEQWNELAKQNGLVGFYFIGHCQNPQTLKEIDDLKSLGFDAINVLHLTNFEGVKQSLVRCWVNYITHQLLGRPYINNYKSILPNLIGPEASREDVFPSLVPNWDHTPRSGRGGYLFENCEPELFERHCQMVFNAIKDKKNEDKIVFLKSWNEWGEGNYMEPDLKYGFGFIDALRRALKD